MAMNIVSGNDGANTLSGTDGDDLIYGYDPNAAYTSAAIAATRVASGLSQPLYVTAAPGDTSRLFIVEKGGTIKILDLNSGQVLATPFLTVPVKSRANAACSASPSIRIMPPTARSMSTRPPPPGRRTTRCGAITSRAIPTSRRPGAISFSTSGPRPTATTMPAGWASGRTAISTSRRARSACRRTRRTTPTCSARFCASTSIRSRRAIRSRPTIRWSVWAAASAAKSGPSACAIRGARASIPRPAISSSAMSAESSFEEINLGVEGRELRLAERRRGRQQSELRRSDLHLSARQRRLGHRRLRLSRRKRRAERPVFLRGLHSEHGLHIAVRRGELGRGQSHIADRSRRRHGRLAGLVRRGRARQSLYRRYRRRGVSPDAERAVVGAGDALSGGGGNDRLFGGAGNESSTAASARTSSTAGRATTASFMRRATAPTRSSGSSRAPAAKTG